MVGDTLTSMYLSMYLRVEQPRSRAKFLLILKAAVRDQIPWQPDRNRERYGGQHRDGQQAGQEVHPTATHTAAPCLSQKLFTPLIDSTYKAVMRLVIKYLANKLTTRLTQCSKCSPYSWWAGFVAPLYTVWKTY